MTDRKPGIYRDISNYEYHAGQGLSATHLRELMRSPLHYKTCVNSHSKETPDMKLGTAIRCAILEPERFDIEYVEAPCIDRRTKDGKVLWSELEQSGKIVLSSDEYSIWRVHSEIMNYLQNCFKAELANSQYIGIREYLHSMYLKYFANLDQII